MSATPAKRRLSTDTSYADPMYHRPSPCELTQCACESEIFSGMSRHVRPDDNLAARVSPCSFFADSMSDSFCPVLVSIEGNIGAGKSTLLSALRKYSLDNQLSWEFAEEPVEEWMSWRSPTTSPSSSPSLLELFYQDKKRWSYALQSAALISRHKVLQRAMSLPCSVVITERCLQTDREVFARMLLEEELMTQVIHSFLHSHSRYHSLANSLTHSHPHTHTHSYS